MNDYIRLFPSCHGTYNAVSYDITNVRLNFLLSLFDCWFSKGERKEDGTIWFEMPSEVATSEYFRKAIKRCGVEIME